MKLEGFLIKFYLWLTKIIIWSFFPYLILLSFIIYFHYPTKFITDAFPIIYQWVIFSTLVLYLFESLSFLGNSLKYSYELFLLVLNYLIKYLSHIVFFIFKQIFLGILFLFKKFNINPKFKKSLDLEKILPKEFEYLRIKKYFMNLPLNIVKALNLNISNKLKIIKENFQVIYFSAKKHVISYTIPLIGVFFIIEVYSIFFKFGDFIEDEKVVEYIPIIGEYVFYYFLTLSIISLIIVFVTKNFLKNAVTLKEEKENKLVKYLFYFVSIFIMVFGILIISTSFNIEKPISEGNLNCSNIIKSSNTNILYVESGSQLNCNLDKNISNFSIIFQEPKNYSINNLSGDKFDFNLPKNEGRVKFVIESNQSKISSFGNENTLISLSTIDYFNLKEKEADETVKTFIGAWIAFFLLIQFFISVEKWLKE